MYDNVIRRNVVTRNGLAGEGAGVLFANAWPGTASYNNLVKDNFIAGNDLSGVTMHAHTIGPGQFEDLSGNKIIGNVIGQGQHRRRPARLACLTQGSADDRCPGVLRQHSGPRHDRPQSLPQRRDRHLAQQASHRARPCQQFVPPCDHADIGWPLSRFRRQPNRWLRP